MIPQEKIMIEELGLTHLSEPEQKQIVEGIQKHLVDVLIETTINNLNPEQLSSMKAELSKENFSEDRIMEITAGIPHLQTKIISELDSEWQLIKNSYQQIK